jgi:homoaconitase/3-isopropylmalate dehydratase large subunit
MVPESIRINVNGTFAKGVTAKDFILKVIGDLKADGADYKSVEFQGPGIEAMSISGRMTICNMGVEMGAKNAVCVPDSKVVDYARKHARRSGWEPVWSDKDAEYFSEIYYRLDDMVPAVAKPGKVDNYAPVKDVEGTKIDQAFLGTCTNARLEDLRSAAAVLKGKKVSVRTIVVPASCRVFKDAIDEGIIAALLEAGCTISHPGCGPCIGVYGGVLGKGEVCISTANRNFSGRMGSRESQIYLASPLTVAYSALCGEIRDPRNAL